MVTSGSRWLLGAWAVAALLAGCSSAPRGPGDHQPPLTSPTATVTVAPPPAGSTGPAGPPPSAPPRDADHPGCRVSLPADWQHALAAGEVPVAGGEHLDVQLSGADGTTFAVSTLKHRHVLQWRRGSRLGVVQDFGDHQDWQVLGATYDGRYLAYRVDQSLENFDDFSLYVWDALTKKVPTKIAHSEKDADGVLMASPFVDPVLAGGWVFWTQTRDHDPGHTVLSGYRISNGHREMLSRGYGRAPVRFGSDLVWSDSDGAAQTTRLRFLDLQTRKRVQTPAALRKVGGIFYLAGDSDTLVWVAGGSGRQLWTYRAGWPAPRLLVDKARAPQFPMIAGDVVVFGQQDAMYAADLRSWSYAKVTPQYGGISADGGPVITVGYAPRSKTSQSVQSLLDTRRVQPLGRAGC